MLKKLLPTTVIIATALGLSTVATANVDTRGFRGEGSGFYLGANVNYEQLNSEQGGILFSQGGGITGKIKGHQQTNFTLIAGYNFNNNLGVELNYTLRNNYTSDVEATSQAGKSSFPGTFTKLSSFGAFAVATLPIQEKWAVYTKLGVMQMNSELTLEGISSAEFSDSISNFAPTLAIGGSYQVINRLNVNLQYQQAFSHQIYSFTFSGSGVEGTSPNNSAISLGLTYQF